MAEQPRRVRPLPYVRHEQLDDLVVRFSELEERVGAIDEDVDEAVTDISDLSSGFLRLATAIFEIQQALGLVGETEGDQDDDVPGVPQQGMDFFDDEEMERDEAIEEAIDAVQEGDTDEAAVWAREEAARLRAEAANEAPRAQQEALAVNDDPNSILDVPDEGVTVDPGRPEGDIH